MEMQKKEYPYIAELGHLHSKKIIAEVFKVREKTVIKWAEGGAPIAVEGDGYRKRYSANYYDLQSWRVNRFKTEESAI